MQYCTDSSQTVTVRSVHHLAFSPLENFMTEVSTIETLVTNLSNYFSAAAAMQ